MFGSRAKQELEEQVRRLKEQLAAEQKAKSDLEAELKSARESVASLKQELENSELEQLKSRSRETIAEYEGLKTLYGKKIQDFDSSREAEEQAFARESALKRFHLEEEIETNRQQNEAFVSETVRTFSESYNYYLDQIKVLMDALSDVATRTGSSLFHRPGGDLKASFGQMLAEELKSGTDVLRGGSGDLIVIGSPEEADRAEKAEPECVPGAEAEDAECAEEAPEADCSDAEAAGTEPTEATEADAPAAEALSGEPEEAPDNGKED